MVRLSRTLVLAALLFAAPAAAEGGAAAAGADALFREAVALAEAGKFKEAANKFEASYELDPARGTLQGWAMAEERAGEPERAYLHYQQLAREAKAAKDGPRAKLAAERMSALSSKVALVALEISGPAEAEGKVTLDGRALDDAEIGTPILVSPGEHVFEGASPSGASFHQAVSAAIGEKVRAQVSWHLPNTSALPAPVEPPASHPERDEGTSSSPLTTIGLIVGGAGVVAGGIGTYLWIDSGKDFDSVSGDCPNGQCPPGTQSRIDDGRSKENLARLLLIGGGAAVAAGVTLFVVGNAQENHAHARAVVGPTGAYLTGRF
ncbi:MAG: tetratricopeptide repeat protein [Myxococcales bacterium]|nr:tetratricopeptide repeat protein [Myxococcales bacterium]MCB9582685.1 tetratricopeptide repeat protein [Polyangiaceae bacterium]